MHKYSHNLPDEELNAPLTRRDAELAGLLTELAEYGFTRISIPGYTKEYAIDLWNPTTGEGKRFASIRQLGEIVIEST